MDIPFGPPPPDHKIKTEEYQAAEEHWRFEDLNGLPRGSAMDIPFGLAPVGTKPSSKPKRRKQPVKSIDNLWKTQMQA
jgi:hypothetical protein